MTAAPLSSTDAARLDLHEDALGHGGRAAHGPGPAAGPETAVLGWRVCAPRPRGPAVRPSSTHNKAQARATTLSQSSVSGLLWGGGGPWVCRPIPDGVGSGCPQAEPNPRRGPAVAPPPSVLDSAWAPPRAKSREPRLLPRARMCSGVLQRELQGCPPS